MKTKQVIRYIRKFIEAYREVESEERLTGAEVAALSKAIEELEEFSRLERMPEDYHPNYLENREAFRAVERTSNYGRGERALLAGRVLMWSLQTISRLRS